MVLMGASFCMFEASAFALTTVPTKTNFQGRLTNSAGNIMPDGLYNMKFRLFTVTSGGTDVWNETRETTNRVQVTNGLFSVRLGDVTPIPASLFASGSLYFEIELPTPATVNCSTAACGVFTEGPMTPRNQLATSAYAYNAETLDGFDSADFGKLIANNTWSGTNLFTGTTDVNSAHFGSTATEIVFAPGASGFTLTGNALFQTGTFSVRNNSPVFKNVSDNAAAFSIQTSGNANMFVVDTSTSRVHIGDPAADASGVALVLDNKSGADPTGVTGAMYYNTTNGKFRCYQNGAAWRDCISSMQDAYNLSTGSTTPEVKLDSTRGGLDIQDANSTIAGSLFAVRGSSPVTLGQAFFDVDNTGKISAQNLTDSATAFTVSDQSLVELFTVDTSNKRVYIGDIAADATGTVLILDTKNNAGDPTGVAGAMYYNSSMHSFRCYQNGVWRSCLGGLAYANTAPATTLTAGGTTEQPFSTTHTIPAGSCQPGRVYRVTAKGVYTTPNPLGGIGTLTLRVRVGGVTGAIAGATPAVALTKNLTNRQWTTSLDMTCITYGNPGTVEGQGTSTIFTAASTSVTHEMVNTGTVGGINMTAAQTIGVTAQYSVAEAGKSIILRQIIVEELGP